MDPSSNDINSSESVEDSQPQPAENITYMNVALYKAAAGGKIKKFNKYQGFELESLLTPNLNTVLHIYLATFDLNVPLGFDPEFLGWKKSVIRLCLTLVKQVQIGKRRFRTSFIEQILDKCPSLLLQPNAKGQTPLHIAARYGHFATVVFLINRAKAPLGDIETPGMEFEEVRQMLRKTDQESNTALHEAVQYGHLEVVQALLEFEDPDYSYSVNRNQETPLYIAARRGDVRFLAEILHKFKSTAHGGPHGRTALHAASMAGDARATREILKKKRNLTQETDKNGQTPLHYAAHLGHYSVVKELLEWDKSAAYIADKTSEMTALLMAGRQGHGRIVREIIFRCPDCCEKVDKRGWNLLHFVAVRHSPPELKRFLEGQPGTRYASITNLRDEKDGRGITPRQVYLTTQPIFKRPVELPYFSNKYFKNKPSMKKRKQIVKLVEDAFNEEVAEAPVRRIPIQNDWNSFESGIEKAREAHLVVAALIATVTFAAAITVPGGYKSEKGPDQGTPFLIHNTAFQAFVITDALAFIFSLVAIAIHFQMTIPFIPHDPSFSFGMAARFLNWAVWAIMIAFCTGTYAVLQPSPPLAIASCCIGLSFHFFIMVKDSVALIKYL